MGRVLAPAGETLSPFRGHSLYNGEETWTFGWGDFHLSSKGESKKEGPEHLTKSKKVKKTQPKPKIGTLRGRYYKKLQPL